nr:uncharacterized mitochondrial protein AtMg00810-like [Tanacetum cinerariifolium]
MTSDGIFIGQEKYVADILKKFEFTTVKTASTPIKPNKALVKNAEAKDVDVHLCRTMIGSLMYLTASRPDITFAVCACARFQVTPKTSHLYAMKRIFRYLKDQPKLGLWYLRDSPFDLEAYSNSDYVGASLDRKSTTGCCQFLFEIFKSLSFCLNRLCHLAILCLDHHAHTLHHLESSLTISLDRLDFLKEDLVNQNLRKSFVF